MLEISSKTPDYFRITRTMEELEELRRQRPSLVLRYNLQFGDTNLSVSTFVVQSKLGEQHIVLDKQDIVVITNDDSRVIRSAEEGLSVSRAVAFLTDALNDCDDPPGPSGYPI